MKVLGNLKRGRVFVVSAPAGTGKTTLVERLQGEFDCVVESVSTTTRAPRDYEVEGQHYHFVTQEAFLDKVEQGEFLEHAEVFGKCYGTARSTVEAQLDQGKHVVLVIDTQGALQLMDRYKATFIFIAPPSLKELRRRLVGRQTETAEHLEERLSWAEHEMEAGRQYDYYIVNDDLENAYTVLKSIFIAEEHRLSPKQKSEQTP